MNARESWLEERRKGIGGSDAAAALGQSRHKTAFQLFQEKRGLIDGDMMFGPDAIERMHFGQALEGVIANMYSRRFGVKLRRHNRIAQHREHPWMLASYDRTIDGRREGLECKNVDSLSYRFGEWGDEHSDAIPQEYLLQCHHYLATSGYDVWHLAACVGGNSLKVYHVERDPEMIDMIIDGEHEFWQHVERAEPPALDYNHRSTLGLLKKMFPGTDGTTVQLPPEAETLHYARVDFDEQAALMESGAKAAKARILHLMGSASVGILPHGGGYTRKIIDRDGYTVDPAKYVDFRFSKTKGAKA